MVLNVKLKSLSCSIGSAFLSLFESPLLHPNSVLEFCKAQKQCSGTQMTVCLQGLEYLLPFEDYRALWNDKRVTTFPSYNGLICYGVCLLQGS